MGLFTKLSSMFSTWQSNGLNIVSCQAMNGNAIMRLEQATFQNQVITILTFLPSNAQMLATQYHLKHGETVNVDIVLGSYQGSNAKIACEVIMNIPNMPQGFFCLRVLPQDAYQIISTIRSGQIVTLLNDHYPSSNFEVACKKSNMYMLNFGNNKQINL